jgi:5-dehydro-2-deoxygluconokinase
MPADATLDVITIGRCSIDLYGQQVGGRLEDMASFAKYVGGCPANIAIGTARLGLKAGFVSRVGDEHMGRHIREEMAREGVDTRHLATDPERLTALVILGIRDEATFPLIFYRENCADMALSEADIDPAYIGSAKAVVVTGTHFTSRSVDAASRKAMAAARAAGRRIVFDIDYRPVLWGLTGHGRGEDRFVADDRITAHLQSILPGCDLVVGTEEELHIAGGSTDTLQAIRNVRALTGAVIVCKRGPMGCVVFTDAIPDSLDKGISGPGYAVEVYNVLGAGDAFMSGFLRGWLRDEALETCCQYANACGAFAVSRHGCAPAIPSWTELEHFLTRGSNQRALRLDPALEQIHWATTRHGHWDCLMALAIDHRSQFEELAASCNADLARVGAFKVLALAAARRVAKGGEGFGMLLDGRLGRQALHAAADDRLWIGRPIELPGSRPLQFEIGPDLGSALTEWPAHHVVKCLVFYHPDDPPALREQQEEKVLTLFDACRHTGHEMMLEIIASKAGAVDATTASRAVARFYDLGVFPDWWKLEPSTDAAVWDNISAVVAERDPHCRGIVLLGLDAAEDELLGSFRTAARYPVVKGFAIGRTVFGAAARDWLSGAIDDDTAVDRMATSFDRLTRAWRELRANGQ